jgi:ribose 5-phosphate isomerase B
MQIKTIAIGSDHAGYNLKLKIKAHLEARGIEVIDVGTDAPESCNYTVFAHALCEAVTGGAAPLGILVCGTGIGMSMAANKHAGIRAAACENTFSARMTRMHNNANVLCLGERVIGYGLACDMVDLFIDTPFEGGRHQARVDDINALDAGK